MYQDGTGTNKLLSTVQYGTVPYSSRYGHIAIAAIDTRGTRVLEYNSIIAC